MMALAQSFEPSFAPDVPADPDAARTWLLRAAEAGHGDAMIRVAKMHLDRPDGVPEARRWLQRAADKGNADAMVALGRLLLKGEDGKADPVSARRLFERAAEGRNAEAMHDIARIYEEGLGVQKDAAAARKWREKAQDRERRPRWRFNLASAEHWHPPGKPVRLLLQTRRTGSREAGRRATR